MLGAAGGLAADLGGLQHHLMVGTGLGMMAGRLAIGMTSSSGVAMLVVMPLCWIP